MKDYINPQDVGMWSSPVITEAEEKNKKWEEENTMNHAAHREKRSWYVCFYGSDGKRIEQTDSLQHRETLNSK